MQIIFISNFLNHHQTEFCQWMYESDGVRFLFLQMERMSEERQQMGWRINEEECPYLVDAARTSRDEIRKCVCDADVIIYGASNLNIFKMGLKPDVLVLYYRERLFKRNASLNVLRFIKLHYMYAVKNRNVNTALLCASAYASADFRRIRAFGNQKYKWGYFPETKRYDHSQIRSIKEKNNPLRILWAGRMISWKRTVDVLELAKILKETQQMFRVDMVGGGELEGSLKMFCIQNNLENEVTFWGNLSQAQVRGQMERSDIFLMTSDYNEGWGAVVNEAMNSGCAVIASHAAGSVPFLIQNGYNGLIYECGNVEEMYQCIKKCIDNPKLRYELGRNAYLTISEEWNAGIAAERLLELICRLRQKKDGKELFDSGICSAADELANDWWFEAERGVIS